MMKMVGGLHIDLNSKSMTYLLVKVVINLRIKINTPSLSSVDFIELTVMFVPAFSLILFMCD